MPIEEQDSEKTERETQVRESEETFELEAGPGAEVPFHIPRD